MPRQAKHEHTKNDIFVTPDVVAKHCLSKMPFELGDTVLDCCAGEVKRPFYENLPITVKEDWCEILCNRDFLQSTNEYDWIVGNIPFSMPKEFIFKMASLSKKGFGILCLSNSMTATRLQQLHKLGFYLQHDTSIYVKEWGFGYKTCFYVFTKTPSTSFSTLIV